MTRAPAPDFLRAVLVLLLGILLLDVMGAMVKTLLPRYGAPELSAWRNLIGMIPSLALLTLSGELRLSRRRLLIRQWPLGLLRGLFVSLAQLAFYLSLRHMELALVSALTYTMSLFVVAFSVPVLGERVGPWRWMAVFLGFAGAIWVVRPESGSFSPWAVLPLAAAALYAASSVTVRLIDREVSNAMVYLYSAFASTLGALAIAALSGGFSPIASLADMARIIAMGLFGGSGVLCLMVAMRLVAPSKLAPFNYFGILSSFAMGWLFLGEAPFARLFPGALLIVAGGLLVIWRERRLAAG